MKRFFEVICFFVPFFLSRKAGKGNEFSAFVQFVLLITANIVSVLIVYLLITNKFLDLSGISRNQARTIGLLSLVPFAVLYWIFRGSFKKKFIEYENLQTPQKEEWELYSRLYIYGTIGLFALCTAGPMLWKMIEQ